MSWTEHMLRERLHKFHTTKYSWQNMKAMPRFAASRKAAVLIPLVLRNGVVHVWLTKRAVHLKNDGGDVAFPGGMKDEDDVDEIHTGLREAEEEIGLKSTQVEIICQLLPRVNRRQIIITPVVGLVDANYIPAPNPDEVESTFCLPLERFLQDRDHTSSIFTMRGINWVTHWFNDTVDGQEYSTWGLTAHMVLQIAIVVFQQSPDFEWDTTGKESVDNPYTLQLEYLTRFQNGATETAPSKL